MATMLFYSLETVRFKRLGHKQPMRTASVVPLKSSNSRKILQRHFNALTVLRLGLILGRIKKV